MSAIAVAQRPQLLVKFPTLAVISALLLTTCLWWLQGALDRREDRVQLQINELGRLPNGSYLKPAMLGYHTLGADLLWLKLVQVIGNKRNTAEEFEWMAHALDAVTTLDPQYEYAYYAGGVILGDLANRPDLSNRLLARGHAENPAVWNIPFLLGYNHYFLMGDPARGAEYLMKAASVPGGPSYLPGLATRMAAEGGKPETALIFLQARLRETSDPEMQKFYVNRMKEVIIERDIRVLQQAVHIYRERFGKTPGQLVDLVTQNVLVSLPQEPFGGEYRVINETGEIASSTHPERLKTFHKRTNAPTMLPLAQPAYVFPRKWE